MNRVIAIIVVFLLATSVGLPTFADNHFPEDGPPPPDDTSTFDDPPPPDGGTFDDPPPPDDGTFDEPPPPDDPDWWGRRKEDPASGRAIRRRLQSLPVDR